MSVNHSTARPHPLRKRLLVAALFAACHIGQLALGGDLERAWQLPNTPARK